MDTDVLVVGAGPTGLMLADQLVRRGVRVRIIDRHSGPAQQSRALGVQVRTLEIHRHLGIDRRAIELGTKGTGANLWTRGRWAARLPFGEIGRGLSPYPHLLSLGQDDNEKLLGELLRLHDVAEDPANDAELARFGIPRPSFHLLRPDGHVGLAGARLRPEAAARYVRERLHLAVRGAALSAVQPLRGEA